MARVMSEEHFSQEVQQQNAIARVIQENLVDQSLGRFADVAVRTGDHRFYEQSDRGKRRKCGMVARTASISPNKVAEPLRFLMRRSGGERIDQDCLELMKERQSDIYYVTGFTTIPPMCPEDPLIDQPSMVALRKNGLVVTYTVHPPAGGLCSCFTRNLERGVCYAVLVKLRALGGVLRCSGNRVWVECYAVPIAFCCSRNRVWVECFGGWPMIQKAQILNDLNDLKTA